MFVQDAKKRSDESAVHLQDVDPDTGEVLNLTRQEFKDECDLNWIIARYTPETIMEGYRASMGQYLDCTSMPDYDSAKNMVLAADLAFASLPAKIRREFNNDVSEFLDYVENPDNQEDCFNRGLLVKVSGDEASSPSDVPPDVSLDVTGGTDTASVS